MVVSWIPLSYTEARGFISNYTVFYTPLTSNGRKRQDSSTTLNVTAGMDANMVTIGDLDSETAYMVQASATNGAGTSQLSAPVQVPVPPGQSAIA